MALAVVSQEKLEALAPHPRGWRWNAAADPRIFSGLGADALILILLDCSGSATGQEGFYQDLARALGKDAAAGQQQQIAVYGYSDDSSPLFEYKRAESDSWDGLDALPQTIGGGTMTGSALEAVASHFAADGDMILVVTDGVTNDSDVALFVREARALRERGVRVAGLVAGPLGEADSPWPNRLFGDDYVRIPDKLPEALTLARQAIAGWLGQEILDPVLDYKVRQVRNDPTRPESRSFADGIFDLNSPGQQGDFSARYVGGRWLLASEDPYTCIEGIYLSPGMEIRDFAVVAALQQARSKYLTPPELSTDAAALAVVEPAASSAPSYDH